MILNEILTQIMLKILLMLVLGASVTSNSRAFHVKALCFISD